MNQICPGPSVHREALFGTGQPRHKRQVMSGVPLEQTADLAGLQLLNAQKILEALSAEMTNAIFIGYKTATANVNLGSREGPKVLPLGTTLEDLLKSYKIYRTTYTSYIEGWVHRVIHDMPSELKKIERNEIFHFSARDPGVYPSQVDLMKYWSYDQVMDKDVEIFARSIRDRLICMYEAFEDIFYQDVYKPNFVTMKRTG
ncbi:hypothetical protein M8J75_016187 [Diaphorina citri]|nr:hypothetical protein M8J75_016187 [Diaphorina citri]KAI5728811.1 hypothetical protein M8J77_021421 [Diaphorina citri]